ncbi:hypothetical protein F2P81_001731 [Scophthalmus maximus]|uniref:Uncharacterized protein n=1 Tax=Scophthalmus maximus TaxID=52904 RepID=A0A6A4TT01_SCOMX|nr:hypothetical protein F2P81_001731 [Scophthalmus maximus]
MPRSYYYASHYYASAVGYSVLCCVASASSQAYVAAPEAESGESRSYSFVWSQSIGVTLMGHEKKEEKRTADMTMMTECGSSEVWEIMTLILSKTDSLINTGGILTGSRPLRWECSGELDCQDVMMLIHSVEAEIRSRACKWRTAHVCKHGGSRSLEDKPLVVVKEQKEPRLRFVPPHLSSLPQLDAAVSLGCQEVTKSLCTDGILSPMLKIMTAITGKFSSCEFDMYIHDHYNWTLFCVFLMLFTFEKCGQNIVCVREICSVTKL